MPDDPVCNLTLLEPSKDEWHVKASVRNYGCNMYTKLQPFNVERISCFSSP
jgi:hypothetical protein